MPFIIALIVVVLIVTYIPVIASYLPSLLGYVGYIKYDIQKGELNMRDPHKARLFEKHLNDDETVVAPGCYDAITAAVVQELGFNAAYMGGWMTGAALGTTEPLLTLLDQVENARRALRLLDIPLIVDGHTGFGDPLHIMRTVQE